MNENGKGQIVILFDTKWDFKDSLFKSLSKGDSIMRNMDLINGDIVETWHSSIILQLFHLGRPILISSSPQIVKYASFFLHVHLKVGVVTIVHGGHESLSYPSIYNLTTAPYSSVNESCVVKMGIRGTDIISELWSGSQDINQTLHSWNSKTVITTRNSIIGIDESMIACSGLSENHIDYSDLVDDVDKRAFEHTSQQNSRNFVLVYSITNSNNGNMSVVNSFFDEKFWEVTASVVDVFFLSCTPPLLEWILNSGIKMYCFNSSSPYLRNNLYFRLLDKASLLINLSPASGFTSLNHWLFPLKALLCSNVTTVLGVPGQHTLLDKYFESASDANSSRYVNVDSKEQLTATIGKLLEKNPINTSGTYIASSIRTFLNLIIREDHSNFEKILTTKEHSCQESELVDDVIIDTCLDERESEFICAKGFDIAKEHDSDVLQNLGCATLCPNKVPIIRYHLEQHVVYGEYRSSQRKFLHDVSTSPAFSNTPFVVVMFNSEDSSTIPALIQMRLQDAGILFLAHSATYPVTPFEILQPDFHFIQTRGFANILKSLTRHGDLKNISERLPTVYWRGSTTGSIPPGRNSVFELPRIKMCMSSINTSWIDSKITLAVQICGNCSDLAESLRRYGIFANRDSEDVWIRHRGILDIDGNVNAWGLYWRLQSGSVIFKIGSKFTNPYINEMVPWVHYIPLKEDFSDLIEVTKIVTDATKVDLLQRIADNAKLLANKFSYESEVTRVASTLLSKRISPRFPHYFRVKESPIVLHMLNLTSGALISTNTHRDKASVYLI